MAIADAQGLSYGAGDFYNNVLREHFLPEVADGINHDYVMLNRAESWKDDSYVEGTFVKHPIHSGRNLTGVGAVGYSTTGTRGKLPTPTSQQYESYTYPVRHQYARILFDGISQDASATDIDSWLRARESEIMGVRDDLARQENRIIHNDGSGILCQGAIAAGAQTSMAGVLLNQLIESPTTMTTAGMAPTNFIEVGGRYMLSGDGAAQTAVGVMVPTAKTDTTIGFASETYGADTFYVSTANEGTNVATVPGIQSSGMGREPMGLAGICSDANLTESYFESTHDTTFQGLTVTGNAFNQATVLANGAVNRTLTEAVLQNAWSQAEKAFQANITCLVGSFGVRDAFADLLLTYRRQVNKMTLSGGFSTVEYNGVPFIADRDCYPNRLMLLDEMDLRQHIMGAKSYRWIDDDGSIYHRLQDEHAFQATLFRRWTFGVMNRARQTILTDLNEL